MAAFDNSIEDLSALLQCPLCGNELQSTFTVQECGHNFCLDCIHPILGRECQCPTCKIPARVGNLLKNPSYDILVACTAKLRAVRQAIFTASEQTASQNGTSSQIHHAEFESGTPIGTVIWTYDCGPTFDHSPPVSSISSSIDMQTFPSLDAALATHRREKAAQPNGIASDQDPDPHPEPLPSRNEDPAHDDTEHDRPENSEPLSTPKRPREQYNGAYISDRSVRIKSEPLPSASGVH
ncbi:hypothetical protein KVV02_003533 [Mortierella alpina]|uniref:RING-type domain-containing protein n=1 Tax=Mortierella alpina TaxID=64518 RepID=A0A9P8CX30_MORAP|nr:hypothetical protein KVV02_003533 [Mortierella alpina]